MTTLTQSTPHTQTLLGEAHDRLPMESSIDVDIVGTLFDSALLQFLLSQNTEQQRDFEMWVHDHAHDATFLSDICSHYPHFYSILQEEILTAHI